MGDLSKIYPIVLLYEEAGWKKATEDCLSAAGFRQWDYADRDGVGSMSKAFNRAFYDISPRREKYIWFVTNVTFPPEMPAVLLELAFMDNPIDNSYLQDDAFKRLAARAITKGVCAYQGVVCENITTMLPTVVETPTLTPLYDGGMCGSGWYELTNQRDQPAYLMLNTASEEQSTHQANWEAELPFSGKYRVEAFIPDHLAIDWQCPEKEIVWDTGSAIYEITHTNGI